MKKTFKHASASEAGDYYQVSFDDGDYYQAKDIGDRYFLIQREFEFPDDGTYYLRMRRRTSINLIESCAVPLNQLQLTIQHDVVRKPRSSDVDSQRH